MLYRSGFLVLHHRKRRFKKILPVELIAQEKQINIFVQCNIQISQLLAKNSLFSRRLRLKSVLEVDVSSIGHLVIHSCAN